MAPQLPPSAYEDVAASRGYHWLGPYTGNVLLPTTWECQEGHRWLGRFHHIKRGHRCPFCAGTAAKTQADYHQLAIRRNWTFIGPVPTDTETRSTWRCSAGHTITLGYQHIKQGAQCPICSKHERQTADHYHALATSLNLTWIEEELPRNTRIPTFWRCTHGHTFERTFDTMRTYHPKPERSCPICSGKLPTSQPESLIAATLDALHVHYQMQKRFSDCKLKKRLPFDFYLPAHNALIEYHGEQHYTPTGYGGGRTTPQASQRLAAIQRRDAIKAAYAQAHSITLHVIPYSDPDITQTLKNIVTNPS
jgi:hypothetical protein